MLKKVLSLILCLCICLGIVLTATSCGEAEESEASGTVPTTITLLGITDKDTKPEDIQAVEDALNKTLKSRYNTKLEITFVPEDEYVALVEQKLDLAKYYQNYDGAIATYNAYMKANANASSGSEKLFGNWIKKRVAISVDTLATRELYLEEMTTVLEDGTIETLYPGARSPIDIIMIANEEMYDEFDALGILNAVDATNTSYKNLQKYIYPTYFSQLRELKGSVKAIPNNNMLAEYTYLVVDKTLADKYDYNVSTFTGYDDLASFLAEVKANESVVPLANVPEALGIFKLFSDDIAIGTYFDPINGYDAKDGTGKFSVQNLFDIPQYTSHLSLMDEYENAGYFAGDAEKDGFAVQVVVGDASVGEKYSAEDSEYYVKVIQNPFVLRETIFDGMLAVTGLTSDANRAMQIVEAINTDADIKNLLQYGIEGVNYTVNDDDTVTRLNNNYMMNNAYTGNVYMGHLEEGMAGTSWAYVKQTNLKSALSPFLIFPVDEAYLDSNLDAILKRTALCDALEPLGISYSEYIAKEGTSTGNAYRDNLKKEYKTYLLDCLRVEGIGENDIESYFSGNAKDYSWYEDRVAEMIIQEKYSTIKTPAALETLVKTTMYEAIGVTYSDFNTAKKNADKYYSNIENLRILAKLTLFPEMTEEEYNAKYASMSASQFENAIIAYVTANYQEENEITDEDYDVLVKSFISSQLVFYDAANQAYTVSWEQFEQAKEDASAFAEHMDKLKVAYNDVVLANGYSQEQIDVLNDVELATVIHDALYYNYYSSLNFTKKDFENYLYDVILESQGTTYNDFQKLRRADPEGYNKILSNLKKNYKKQLLTTMTKDEYNDLALNAVLGELLTYFIEDYSGIYAAMCDVAGVSYDKFVKDLEYMETYVRYVNRMKTSFLYTLRTVYTDEEISAFTFDDIEVNVYNAVRDFGYYTNEMAKYVGMSLSNYMLAKSDAVKYTGYITALVDAYSDEIEALPDEIIEEAIREGFIKELEEWHLTLVEGIKNLDPEDIEALVYEIVDSESYSNYYSVETNLEVFSSEYFDGLENADDIDAYCAEAAAAMNEDPFFSSLVAYLNENLQNVFAEAEK